MALLQAKFRLSSRSFQITNFVDQQNSVPGKPEKLLINKTGGLGPFIYLIDWTEKLLINKICGFLCPKFC